MNPEDVIKKRIARKRSYEDALLLDAIRSMTSIRTKELADAGMLLAKTTELSAEQLAKTTKASAEQLRAYSEITERLMKRLTVVGIFVGVVQIALAIVAVVISLQL